MENKQMITDSPVHPPPFPPSPPKSTSALNPLQIGATSFTSVIANDSGPGHQPRLTYPPSIRLAKALQAEIREIMRIEAAVIIGAAARSALGHADAGAAPVVVFLAVVLCCCRRGKKDARSVHIFVPHGSGKSIGFLFGGRGERKGRFFGGNFLKETHHERRCRPVASKPIWQRTGR